MKLKLDENLGTRCAEMLRFAGHDVATVQEESLCSSTDNDLLKVCLSERRCLITLDLEFGNPLKFNPTDYEGIVVLRLPRKPTLNDFYDAIKTLIRGFSQGEISKKLWIVQRGRIREYQPEE